MQQIHVYGEERVTMDRLSFRHVIYVTTEALYGPTRPADGANGFLW